MHRVSRRRHHHHHHPLAVPHLLHHPLLANLLTAPLQRQEWHELNLLQDILDTLSILHR